MTKRSEIQSGNRRWILLFLASVLVLAATMGPSAASADESPALWLTSAEVGVGPIEDELFLHLTPRLTYLRPVQSLLCTDDEDCETMFEASLHVPLRLGMTDRDDGIIRRRDWVEVSDYFRIIRRIEYGSSNNSVHLRGGEIGPANLGHGTIVNGYFNVITTDHYRLGLTGDIDRPDWGAELMVNDLTAPNLVGARGRYRPPYLYEPDSDWQKVSLGISLVTDLTAPYRLDTESEGEQFVAGTDLYPVVDESRPTVLVGTDVQWDAFGSAEWSLSPYADLNHHFGLGSGLHAGLLWDHNIGDSLRLSSRFEYRLLGGHYVPDYFNPVYEITRYRHPHPETSGYAGPKLRAAASSEGGIRHGAFGQFRTRIADWITFSAAFSDATGPTGADVRLRASVDYEDRAGVGLFFYQFTTSERDFSSTASQLARIDGALTALEGRLTIWGPIYAQGQFARQWQLREDGTFENIQLWNLGVGAGSRF